MANPTWYEPAVVDAEHLEWLEGAREPVIDPELSIVDVSQYHIAVASQDRRCAHYTTLSPTRKRSALYCIVACAGIS